MPASNLVKIVRGPQNSSNDLEFTEDLFGGIFTTFQSKAAGIADYHLHADSLGLTHIRWPGGTLARAKKDTKDADGDGDKNEFIYDLSHPDVHLKAEATGKAEFGLSGVMKHAVEQEIAFSMIVPVERYFDDLGKGEEVLEGFLDRLLTKGEFGELPKDFTLEMGNENLANDLGEAADYGATSNAFMSIINDFLSDPAKNPNGHDLKVAVQGGRSMEMDEIIRDQISTENADLMDSVVFHYLNLNIRDGQKKLDEREDLIKAWENQFGDDLEVYASAWTVGPSKYVDGTTYKFSDVGAMMGRSTVDAMVSMVKGGVDSANVWGADISLNSKGEPINPNWFTTGETGEVIYSHGGYALQLMAESLPGKKLVMEEGTKAGKGGLIDGDYRGLDPYGLYGFEGDGELVLFLTANNIDSNGETARIDVSDYTQNGTASLVRIHTDFNNKNDKYDDQALRQDKSVEIKDGVITVPITQDFELFRVTVEYDQGNTPVTPPETPAPVVPSPIIVPVEEPETGGGAGAKIVGGRDDDTLTGGDGDDTLIGGAGDDELRGGSGADVMQGGVGSDSYFVNSTSDRIKENAGEGFDTVFASVDFSLRANSKHLEDLKLMGANANNAYGNGRDNHITGTGGDNKIKGGWGDDRLEGWRGADTLVGGQGEDTLLGGRGDDVLQGGRNDDVIRAGRGDDLLSGGDGDDTLAGSHGSDTLDGGAGTNHLNGGRGADVFVASSLAGTNVIGDFEIGTDEFLIAGLGNSANADDLRLEQTGDNVSLFYDGDENYQIAVFEDERVEEFNTGLFSFI